MKTAVVVFPGINREGDMMRALETVTGQKPVARNYSFGLNAVVTGLEGSEKIINEGKQNLRPGAKVKLAEAASGPKREGGKGKKGSTP